MNLADLSAEFPRDAVHWRAQSLTKDKTKAMALAYIDARDVMDRLDDVCRPEGWQCEYTETASGRVLCRIGIHCGDQWIWKGDGAGSTQVEAEKGGISDALKRAAVAWGVGRYLYRLDTPWVPCEVNGKGQWKKWIADPWGFVRAQPQISAQTPAQTRDRLKKALESQSEADALSKLWSQDSFATLVDGLPEPMRKEVAHVYNTQFNKLAPEHTPGAFDA